MKFISSIKVIVSCVVLSIISNSVNSRNLREQAPGSLSPFMSVNPSGLDVNDIDNMKSFATKPNHSYRFSQKTSEEKKQDAMEDSIANKYKGVNKFKF